MKPLKSLKELFFLAKDLSHKIEKIQLTLGRIENKQNQTLGLIKPHAELSDLEFSSFSQWGEDGIIQYLIQNMEIPQKIFVEFGVENYLESNTRFLLQNNNWAGLVFDGSEKHITQLKSDPIYWRFNLKAETAFITRENINELIKKNGISGEIGLLSVDIDGNDYWVWQAIDSIKPRIVICEYNSTFGPDHAVTIPYDASFQRNKAHYSNLYYGCSIAALELLGHKKGYTLVGSNSAGNNAFFVRNDLGANFVSKSAKQAWVASQFRESRNQAGELTFLSLSERLEEIKDLPLIDVKNEKEISVKEIMLRKK